MRFAQKSAALQETECDAAEREAFNAAFRELGLRWHWDAGTFRELGQHGSDEARVRAHLETRAPHLLKVYDAAFLADAVCAAKRDHAARTSPRRPGRYSECADFATAQTGF